MRHQHVRRVAELDDRHDLLQRLERELLRRRRRCEAARHYHEGVAVGVGPRGQLHADDAGRAATVVDHELLAERLGEFLRYGTRGEVAAAAWSERYNHAYRLRWIGLSDGWQRVRQRPGKRGHGGKRYISGMGDHACRIALKAHFKMNIAHATRLRYAPEEVPLGRQEHVQRAIHFETRSKSQQPQFLAVLLSLTVRLNTVLLVN